MDHSSGADQQELYHSPKIRRQSEFPPDPDPDFFFQNLQFYRQLSSVIKHHAFASRLFIGPPPHDFERVYRVEEIDELANDLSKISGKSVKIPRLNRSVNGISLDELSEKTKNKLAELLQQEYSDLSNFYTNPFE